MILQTPICEPSHKIPYDISTDYRRLKQLLDASYIIVAITPMQSAQICKRQDENTYCIAGQSFESDTMEYFEKKCSNLEVAFIDPNI